jgi:hypothetical protein
LHLDLAQENRSLSANERDLSARLKRKVIALAMVERERKKQSARIHYWEKAYSRNVIGSEKQKIVTDNLYR